MRDQVFLRENLRKAVASIRVGSTGEGEQAAGGVEYRGGGTDPRGSEKQSLPGLFDADLFMRVTLAGGSANAREADRWGAETGTRERGKREQRPLCADTGDHLGNNAGILAASSQPGVAISS